MPADDNAYITYLRHLAAAWFKSLISSRNIYEKWKSFRAGYICILGERNYGHVIEESEEKFDRRQDVRKAGLIDWLTALRHISTERLLVPRNVAK